jgi:hypothetical protein
MPPFGCLLLNGSGAAASAPGRARGCRDARKSRREVTLRPSLLSARALAAAFLSAQRCFLLVWNSAAAPCPKHWPIDLSLGRSALRDAAAMLGWNGRSQHQLTTPSERIPIRVSPPAGSSTESGGTKSYGGPASAMTSAPSCLIQTFAMTLAAEGAKARRRASCSIVIMPAMYENPRANSRAKGVAR